LGYNYGGWTGVGTLGLDCSFEKWGFFARRVAKGRRNIRRAMIKEDALG
jgi:hypothetical protein